MTDNVRPIARLATPEDVEEIARICGAGWRDTYRERYPRSDIEEIIGEFYAPQRIATEIGAKDDASWGGYVVAEQEGRILVAGGGGMTEPTTGELFVLYADPARRRRGGGSAVLRLITDQQIRHGAVEQWVSVDPDNHIGASFYRAHGFVEQGRRPAYRGERESLRLRRRIE